MEIRLQQNNIIYHKGFIKDLKKFDIHTTILLEKKLIRILKNPEMQRVKSLKNYPFADWRLKLGDYRILFIEDKKKQVFIFLGIKHRKNLY